MEEIEALRRIAEETVSSRGMGNTVSVNAWRNLAWAAESKGQPTIAINSWKKVRLGLGAMGGSQQKGADAYARRRIGVLRSATDLSTGIEQLRELADEFGEQGQDAQKIDVLTEVAGLLAQSGNISQAAETFLEVGQERAELFGKCHPLTARGFADAASRYQEVGETLKAIKARQFHIESLELMESSRERDCEMAEAHEAIACMSLIRGEDEDHVRARDHAQRAVAIREVVHPAGHEAIMGAKALLTNALVNLQQWDEALTQAEQLRDLRIEAASQREQIEEAIAWVKLAAANSGK